MAQTPKGQLQHTHLFCVLGAGEEPKFAVAWIETTANVTSSKQAENQSVRIRPEWRWRTALVVNYSIWSPLGGKLEHSYVN